MRKGWEYKKLGEVTSFFRGLTYSGKDEVDKSNNIVLRSNNIDLSTNSLNFDELKFISDSITIPQDKKLRKNSIFMCMSNGSKQHLGKVAFIEKEYPYAFGGFMGLIVPNEDKLVPKFTYYYFCSQKFKAYLSAIGNGANINNIKYNDIAKDSIPLPPLSTQLAIVSELDKINELIRLKKEQLKDFNNLAQSLFYEMFGDPVENEKGWEVKKLNEIVSDNCSISYGIVQPGDGVENGVPVVRPVDMTKTFVSRKGLKNTTKEISDSYKRTILKGNEILMCVRGTTGLISMATPELQGCNVTRGIAPIECGPTCDKWFVFYQILNPAIQHHIAEYTRGIALKQINMKDVRDIPLCLPPLSLQRLFAQRIEQIEREKSEVQKSIQDLETLLASRMQYWFE